MHAELVIVSIWSAQKCGDWVRELRLFYNKSEHEYSQAITVPGLALDRDLLAKNREWIINIGFNRVTSFLSMYKDSKRAASKWI